MIESNRFDVLIIGAGQAGIPLAHALTKAGKRVALAEEKDLGGSCVNFGCTPTKAVIASARVARLARRGKEFGLKIPTVEIDFPAVLERAKQILIESRTSLQKGFEKTDNPKLLHGSAHFDGRDTDAFRMTVGDRLVVAEQVVLDTGTRSTIPPIDYRILLSQLAGDGSRTTSARVVPYAIFTDPELGRVGMTESEALKSREEIKVARYEMKGNGKARELGETEGFIKVIIDTETNRILGAAVLAAEGAELIHLYVDMMNTDAPYTVIREAIHIHPTLAEAIQSAVKSFE